MEVDGTGRLQHPHHLQQAGGHVNQIAHRPIAAGVAGGHFGLPGQRHRQAAGPPGNRAQTGEVAAATGVPAVNGPVTTDGVRELGAEEQVAVKDISMILADSVFNNR